ncbi:MAG TPA: hypothetical protein VFF33_04625 [Ignavibacteriaceae bacterium]|nr:hypothetical protein [Ignavibacteriaceae bacterium]
MKHAGKILLTVLFSSAIFIIAGCSCSKAGAKQEQTEIPKNILDKSKEIIVAKTGEEFFEKYISPDYTKSKYVAPNYYLVYHFVIPDKKYVNEDITMTLDSLGNPIAGTPIVGIPDCNADEKNCTFNVDEEAIVHIAEANNFEKGVKPWTFEFMWSDKWQQYAWHVRTVFNESTGTNGYRGSGKELVIDPSNGAVLETSEWQVR